jgi:hypothetical protein
MPAYSDREHPVTQNIDDALAFLVATGLVYEYGNFFGISFASNLSPDLLILRQMNRLARREIEAKHPLDPLYIAILDEVFIRPNRLFVDRIHIEVNKLRQAKAVGGLSQEKVQAWKRVMAFLGVGKKVGSGFQCVYAPALLRTVLHSWPEKSASLQSFFETHLTEFLPFETESKRVAQAVSEPLRYLAMRGEITLESRQDSPSKAYFGDQRFQYITHSGGMA